MTSYLDLGVIYSTSATFVQTLRTFKNGQFKLNAAQVLPETQPCSTAQCYFAGDARVTQTIPLALCHSLFYRLHNFIANGLSECNQSSNDQKLFDETRRIVIAIYQHIISEWLRIFLGLIYMQNECYLFINLFAN